MDKDSPLAFNNLTKSEQDILLEWCKDLVRIKATNHHQDTYTVKHLFSKGRFYITNGAMKGALLLTGFTPFDTNALNWKFNISERSLKKLWKEANN